MKRKTVRIIRAVLLVGCIALLAAGGYLLYKQQIAPKVKEKQLQAMYPGSKLNQQKQQEATPDPTDGAAE